MISKEEWDAFINNNIKDKIEEHITNALIEIYKIYDGKLDTWYYPGAAEGQMGQLQCFGDSINIECEGSWPYNDEPWYSDENGGWSLTCYFPVHFLFISVDEIKEKVTAYKLENEEAERQRKEKEKKKKEAKKAKKETLKRSAAKKLTIEERKILGLK